MNEERMKARVEVLKRKKSAMQMSRGGFPGAWEDVRRYIRINAESTNTTVRQAPGYDVAPSHVFDSTAPWALDQFAAGLHAYLTSPVERWFNLTVSGVPDNKLDKQTKEWLESVSDLLYYHYSLPSTNLDPSLHEAYLDLGGFGTCVMYQEIDNETNGVYFRTFGIGCVDISEDSRGRIDTVFRQCKYTVRQLLQEWPDAANLTDRLAKMKEEDTVDVIHSVFPNTDRDVNSLVASKRSKYSSVWWMESPEPIILSDSGYDTMPYHVARWSKLTGEVFGRSPGLNCIADVKMVNVMSREIILSAELANKPPLVVEDDSLLSPINGMQPGKVYYKQPGTEAPVPLMSGSQPQLTLELTEQRRDSIRQSFFTDLLMRTKKKERQSVLEIQDDRSEMVRQLTPMFGRIQVELLTPILRRTFDILVKNGTIKDIPSTLTGRYLDIQYTNPAARAQVYGKAASISALVQDLAAVAQFDPSVLGVVDWHEAASTIAEYRDVPQAIIKDREVWAQEREAQAQAQAQAAQTQNMQASAGALKDVAQARATDPTLLQ